MVQMKMFAQGFGAQHGREYLLRSDRRYCRRQAWLLLIFAGIIAVGFLADAMARPAIPGTILFMAIVGFGLYGLADALVYARYG